MCFYSLQIYDKSEALTHQRLISRMLAEKTRQLEHKLQHALEGNDDVFLEKSVEGEAALPIASQPIIEEQE